MINVRRDFNSRVFEIDLYFRMLRKIVIDNAKLRLDSGSIEIFDNDLKRVLIANCFLLLYNLTEATIKNSIEEVYIAIDNTGATYDQLHLGLRKEILGFLKKHKKVDDLLIDPSNIARDIVLNCYDTSKLISGNMDARKMRNIANDYHIPLSVKPFDVDGVQTNLRTDYLLTVKSRRNDLAHGVYSFKDCGKDYTYQDIVGIKIHVVEYLRQFIDTVDQYIISRKYIR